jgi:hypothetical protein
MNRGFFADHLRDRCLNTAFRSAGLRAIASRNGARCFLPRWLLLLLPPRLPSTLRRPLRRSTPALLRVLWVSLGCLSSDRDSQKLRIFFFFSSFGDLFVGSAWSRRFVLRFFHSGFLRSFLGRAFSRSSSWDLFFFLSFWFRSCYFSLSLFDDTHIRLLKISALPAEGRGYEEFLFLWS